MKRPDWFVRSWGCLARAVLEAALEDLAPTGEDHHVSAKNEKASAIQFFESRRFWAWAQAAGLAIKDVEQGYLDQLDKTPGKA